jgi:hypothetical protein
METGEDKTKLAHLAGGNGSGSGHRSDQRQPSGSEFSKFMIMLFVAIMMGLVLYVNSRLAE